MVVDQSEVASLSSVSLSLSLRYTLLIKVVKAMYSKREKSSFLGHKFIFISVALGVPVTPDLSKHTTKNHHQKSGDEKGDDDVFSFF